MSVEITVDEDELAKQIPIGKMIAAYGPSNVLGQFTAREIVIRFDNDSLLEAIGEERIRDFLSFNKQEIA